MRNISKTYKTKLVELGLYLSGDGKPRPPYSLRHYYATQRLLGGVQVFDLAKNMGTSVEQIENHYGHVSSVQKTNELIQRAPNSFQQYFEEDKKIQKELAKQEKKLDKIMEKMNKKVQKVVASCAKYEEEEN